VTAGENAVERNRMVAALTTNFTRFFREGHHFNHLKTEALPPLLSSLRQGRRLRIWSAGCSNGQEPYTIAMSLLEVMPDAASYDVRILATDINTDVLAQAEAGVYDESALADVPAAFRERWFERAGEKRRVKDEVRNLIAFRQLNLIQPTWPMRGQFEIIFCRNVAIYFDEETQERLWSRFAQVLLPGSYLYIGHSERVSGPAAPAFSGIGITTYRHLGRAQR
jgi:chemotaxis protein methyltransferase CheR